MAALNWRIFSKKSGWLSSAGPEIQAYVSHCSANFQPILDCFIPNFKLKYENSENVKADLVNTDFIRFQLTSNQTSDIFGTPSISDEYSKE